MEENRTLEQERDAILNELHDVEYDIEDYEVLLNKAIAIQKEIDDYELKKLQLANESKKIESGIELEEQRIKAEKKKNLVNIVGAVATVAAAGITAGVAIYTTKTKIKHSENLAQYVYDNEKEMRIANGKLYNISQEISK